jgi:hypothetical protein
MEKLGAPKEIVDQLNNDKKITVFAQNWSVVLWFLQVCDFIRFRHDGRCLGLDMQQVQVEAQMSNRAYTTDDFNGLRVMSIAAARAINKVSDE